MLKQFNQVTRIIIGGAIAIVIWIAGILIGQEQTVTILNPEDGLSGLITRTRNVQVSLMVDYGDGRVKVFPEVKLKYGSSALDLLEQAEAIDKTFNIDYSLDNNQQEITNLVINGYPSQLTDRKWLVWLNNILQIDEINQVRLKSGDVVEYKYINLVN